MSSSWGEYRWRRACSRPLGTVRWLRRAHPTGRPARDSIAPYGLWEKQHATTSVCGQEGGSASSTTKRAGSQLGRTNARNQGSTARTRRRAAYRPTPAPQGSSPQRRSTALPAVGTDIDVGGVCTGRYNKWHMREWLREACAAALGAYLLVQSVNEHHGPDEDTVHNGYVQP